MKLIGKVATTLMIVVVMLSSCTSDKFKFEKIIDLGETTPLGLIVDGNTIWISDGDHNELVSFDLNGKEKWSKSGFERPMHIDVHEGVVYIPEYGNDQILKFTNDTFDTIIVDLELDAPAGISIVGKQIAIADFYNHRIAYSDGISWKSFGEEGNAPKQFYYPTDVQIFDDKLFIADAYNNRVQVLTTNGELVKVIGEEDEMNASTGIFVDADNIIITDFENDRVVIYDHEGKLLQVIADSIQKPTDVFISEDRLFVANYSSNSITVYAKLK